MRSVGRKLVAACGVLAMACTMAACGGDTASDADDNSLMTVEVFDQLANYQGERKGWFAKVIKDKFNIKLNIVAPNVAGGGNTLFDTRAAAGNLGDIVIIGSGSGQAEKVVKSKLVTDLSSYIKNTKYLKTYQGDHRSVDEGCQPGERYVRHSNLGIILVSDRVQRRCRTDFRPVRTLGLLQGDWLPQGCHA